VRRGWIECPEPPVRAGAGSEISVVAWVRAIATPHTQTVVARQLDHGPEDHFFLWGLLGHHR
jgi:hypothetical protein